MITGIGTDIIEIERIERAMERHKSFALRIFTPKEIEYCLAAASPGERFAGRFAAKEAVGKALGRSLSWLDVEILPDEQGRPIVRLAAPVGCTVMVSISHCRSYAVAYAVAIKE
ncbi:MAG: holo-ACP synthase [Armatimonadota bacterium]